jgi:hypothetical protein
MRPRQIASKPVTKPTQNQGADSMEIVTTPTATHVTTPMPILVQTPTLVQMPAQTPTFAGFQFGGFLQNPSAVAGPIPRGMPLIGSGSYPYNRSLEVQAPHELSSGTESMDWV